jgi:hypothetical protein
MSNAPGFVRVSGSRGGQLWRLGATDARNVCDIQANCLSYLLRCSTCLSIQSNSRSAICRLFLSSMNMCVLP